MGQIRRAFQTTPKGKIRIGMGFESKFLSLIQSKNLPNVFNPYTDQCEHFDALDASTIRSKNFLQYIAKMIKLKPTNLWVAESLGYKGGRRTGLPLTDDLNLMNLRKIYGIREIKVPSNRSIGELTATQIWSMICKLLKNQLPFLWNIFPLHPYKRENQLSNRSLLSSELEEVKEIIIYLLESFKFSTIIAIGKKPYTILNKLGYDPILVRHPSHGGSLIFKKQIQSIYDIL